MSPVHQVWPKPSCKAQWKGEEDKAERGRGGKTTSGNGQAWRSPSPRGQWRTGKNGRKWLRNHLWCPNDPRGWGIDEMRWWWPYKHCIGSGFCLSSLSHINIALKMDLFVITEPYKHYNESGFCSSLLSHILSCTESGSYSSSLSYINIALNLDSIRHHWAI